ncbi:extracellular solute-binding protein [Corynebacterium sp. A21]|uniref:extracellular solute-binding protein n=1 Tax=Corynebacterium sp. A21 TaxID=3457318 RepID=UPI003FCF4BB7
MQLSRILGTTATIIGIGALVVGCAPGNQNPSTQGAGSGVDGAESVELVVLGAASTRVINEELSELSEQELEFINAGSATLVQQLSDGSPGDLLITADQASMDRAVDQGVVGGPVAIATNSMVMVVPAGNPAGITGVDSSLEGANVVLCDPQVPCGAVSGKIMADQGIELQAASLEHSVADTLGKVTSGEADAGWVYRTDAQAAGDTVAVFEIPGAEQVLNTLVAAVSTDSANPEQAQALLELITGEDMAGVWEDNGFTPEA